MLKPYEEAARCLLCAAPPCSAACRRSFDPAGMVRSVRFENEEGGAERLEAAVCLDCPGDCEAACLHYDRPIRIRALCAQLPARGSTPADAALRAPCSAGDSDPSLRVKFLGLDCLNPFFLSSSIVAGHYDTIASAFRAGWAGAVYKTIGFLTPKEVSPRFDALRKEGTPFIGFKNLEQISDLPLSENLAHLRRLKRDFPDRIVAASIMGQNEKEWSRLTELVTEAGVDLIECNFSCPHMSGDGLGSDVGQNPLPVARYTNAVRRAPPLPILAKMTPNVGNIEPAAIAAVNAGADGLAAINTVKSLLSIDPGSLSPDMAVGGRGAVSGYSGKAVKPIALRFIRDLAQCSALRGVPISGMGGIESWRDALDFIALGCLNLQVTTAVMQYGYRIIDDLTDGLRRYLARQGLSSPEGLVGAALDHIVSPEGLDRDSIVYPTFRRSDCVGCGRCMLSCSDAGHGAIGMRQRRPVLKPDRCVGCQLCRLVCPTGAIGSSRRTAKPSARFPQAPLREAVTAIHS